MKNIIKALISSIGNFMENKKYHHKFGDLFLAHKTLDCNNRIHNFPVIVTTNGARVDDVSPCQCKKYKNIMQYYIDSEP